MEHVLVQAPALILLSILRYTYLQLVLETYHCCCTHSNAYCEYQENQLSHSVLLSVSVEIDHWIAVAIQ